MSTISTRRWSYSFIGDAEPAPAPQHVERFRVRVQTLEPAHRAALSAAAVLGDRCRLEELAALILQPELAIGGGMLLLTLLVGNRLFTEDLLNSQSRADLIATVAPVLIILKALGDLDITPKEADPVPPVGVATAWVEPSLPSAVQSELQWAAESVLIPPCTAAALWRDDSKSASL